MKELEPGPALPPTARRDAIKAAVGAIVPFLLASCRGGEPAKKNPPNYHWGHWRSLAITPEVREALVDLGRDPSIPEGVDDPIDFKSAVLLGTPREGLRQALQPGSRAVALAFQTSEDEVQVGVLDPSVKLGEVVRGGKRFETLFARLGRHTLYGTWGVAELNAGGVKAGAKSLQPLPTEKISRPIPVGQMDPRVPLL